VYRSRLAAPIGTTTAAVLAAVDRSAAADKSHAATPSLAAAAETDEAEAEAEQAYSRGKVRPLQNPLPNPHAVFLSSLSIQSFHR